MRGLELETFFEDDGVFSRVITDSLSLERALYERCALVQSHQPHSWPTGKGVLVSCLTAFPPPHTSGFTLQILDLAHIWSDSDADVIELDDILAVAAAVYMFIKMNLLPLQRYPSTLPELLTAVAELLPYQASVQ